jgi:hypothetical protein
MARPHGVVGHKSYVHVLMYHHLQDKAACESSGGRSYHVSVGSFADHLQALSAAMKTAPSTNLGYQSASSQWAITFDDGAESALLAADLLEAAGWRAYFFIVSAWMGNPGFLNASEVAELRSRGHVVGSHSRTHPEPMSGLRYPDLVKEWRASVKTLSEVIGEPVNTAAVPGGGYSASVAAAAAEAGINVLFTSEPVMKTRLVQSCWVVGRYAIRCSTHPSTTVALAAGRPGACGAQWLGWNSRKLAKRVLGKSYYTIRSRILDQGTTKRC